MKFTRRTLLLAASSAVFTASKASSENLAIILRDEIDGVHPRYASYASVGPYTYANSPMTLKADGFDIIVFAPQRVAEARIIVFSHGALADPLTYREIIWHWVSHGFVVAAPLHRDAVLESGPTLRKSNIRGVSEWPIATLLEDPHAWGERVRTCSRCLDLVPDIERLTGIKINLERPLVAGHGYGAYVAQLLLGAKVLDGEKEFRVYADHRFFSGIIMAPQGPGVMGLSEQSWDEIAFPMLFLVSENDHDFTGQPAIEKAKSYSLAKPGYKHMGFLNQGSSNSFYGHLARTNEREKKIFESVIAMTTCFILAYMNYEAQAFTDMTTDFFQRMSLGVLNEGRR